MNKHFVAVCNYTDDLTKTTRLVLSVFYAGINKL
jgi:hypothetical protein